MSGRLKEVNSAKDLCNPTMHPNNRYDHKVTRFFTQRPHQHNTASTWHRRKINSCETFNCSLQRQRKLTCRQRHFHLTVRHTFLTTPLDNESCYGYRYTLFLTRLKGLNRSTWRASPAMAVLVLLVQVSCVVVLAVYWLCGCVVALVV